MSTFVPDIGDLYHDTKYVSVPAADRRSAPARRSNPAQPFARFPHLEAAPRQPAVVGPYARLRPGAKLAEAARRSAPVEIKNAPIDITGAKVSHRPISAVPDRR
jgi:hypothetical protein